MLSGLRAFVSCCHRSWFRHQNGGSSISSIFRCRALTSTGDIDWTAADSASLTLKLRDIELCLIKRTLGHLGFQVDGFRGSGAEVGCAIFGIVSIATERERQFLHLCSVSFERASQTRPDRCPVVLKTKIGRKEPECKSDDQVITSPVLPEFTARRKRLLAVPYEQGCFLRWSARMAYVGSYANCRVYTQTSEIIAC